ncbi:hypothetical protein ACFQS1_23205 [Paractinoplanes rhizophilus]|jgi:hypothetical protein|uniref:Adhesin domain-containing protein n=1 Tax=Paractinoplanes rhizophilus TaxID=1416877 RepID=A0ABW2HUZ6_9ACTN|nr:hypothetical protein [Actinoplanes sp.]
MVALLLVGALAGCASPTSSRSGPVPAQPVAAGSLLGRTGAYLTVEDAASRVEVITAALPGLLYRVTTPADGGLTPHVTSENGHVRATLRPNGAGGPDEVRIVLNRDVRWAISLPAGAGEQRLDLRRGRVTRLVLGASGLLELHLPAPAGTVPITLAGAVGSVVVDAAADAGVVPGATPLRVELAQGAGFAELPWRSGRAITSRAVVETPGWSKALDRYAITAHSTIGSLTVR